MGSMLYIKSVNSYPFPPNSKHDVKNALGFFLCAFECHQLYGIDEIGVGGQRGSFYLKK